jgi:hypothetical protein
MNVLQIVSSLPPALDGVGGHALALARALAAGNVMSRFLVAAPSQKAAAGTGGLPETAVAERGSAALARQLAASGTDLVLVHYVNYAYERRGCPAWLVGGLARWRAGAPGRRLVSVFHEVYASGPPWRSSFWLSPIQRRLAARLLRASDAAVTSLDLYGRMLARWRPRRAVAVAPVLSTVGEPAAMPPPAERRPRVLLVFGSAGNRCRAYGQLRPFLASASRALKIVEIVDLGPTLADLPAAIDGVPVRALGPLPEEQASAVLSRAFAGFLGYPPPLLGKSSIFAAYCAHGLVPVCAWPRPGRPASPREDAPPPCWNPCAAAAAPAEPAALAARALDWYHEHDAARQAAWYHDLFSALRAGVAVVERRLPR